MTCNGRRKIVLISVTSLNFSLIFRSKTYLKMVICDKCNIEGCAWSTYQEDLIRYWLQCRQCGRPFGEIGRVEDCNRRARNICYIKCNSYVDVDPDTPCPTCVVVGLSYLFPSLVFEDGTELPDFMQNNRRDGHTQDGPKRKRVSIDVLVTKH